MYTEVLVREVSSSILALIREPIRFRKREGGNSICDSIVGAVLIGLKTISCQEMLSIKKQ